MKKFYVDEYVKIKYKDKEIEVPTVILLIVEKFKKKIKRKLDGVVIITGEVGSGKSTMAQLIAGLHEYNMDRELSIKNFTWTSQGLVDFTDREDNETESIVFDEAISGGTGRDSITKIGNALKITLVTKRRKRHLYLFLVDEVQELSKKIISRCDYMINVKFKDRNYNRGHFELFKRKELLELYYAFKNQKIRYLEQWERKSHIIYNFKDYTNVFINEKEYEDKKIQETKMELEKVPEGKIAIERKWLDALELKRKGLSQVKIGNKLGVSKTTIQDWLNKLATIGIT